ncbi:hypothetical protein FNV43_RR07181 [Rhamnella rubrinervis]|uniref:La-related protein 6B n=1 Tax=Rhamnella rubrinervis TaxID=2594499 RepID=A0A8K0HEG3_9ROSA|nr:hypothetical protein FNV43_RR07181 [Rhamnella rubrinervis]
MNELDWKWPHNHNHTHSHSTALDEGKGQGSLLSLTHGDKQNPNKVAMAQDEAPSTSSDPSLSRNVSFSRLNARAPEFVPSPRSDLHAISPPSPPPPPPPQVYHSSVPSQSPPFHVVPSHVIPSIQNHHHHHHHHPHPHHHLHHLPLQYQQHHHYYDYAAAAAAAGGGGFAEQDVVVRQQQPQLQPQVADPLDHSAPSKNKLSDEAALKILNQVEYYFSDLNLATTDHLMRFISKDPEGFVPISVVSSFKKIKALTNSHAQLATVLRNSSKLEVSEDGKKVRRQQPLTESDMEELQSRIIVAENLPEDHCHQNLMKVFSSVGSVKTIRTCQPQMSSGGASSASRSAKVDSMLFSNKLHAFVEYESVELAEKAAAELNNEGSWRSGLRVRLMLRRMSKPVQARGRKGLDGDAQFEEDDTCTTEQLANEKQSEDSSQQSDANSHEQIGEEHCNDKEGGGQRKGRTTRGRSKGRGRGGVQYHQPQNNHHRGNHVHVGTTTTTPHSNNVNNNNNNNSNSVTVNMDQAAAASVAKQPPPGPRMPDGTRGFAMGRGKPLPVNNIT